jgi:ketol-acid reductoisomerase
MRYSVSDTAEHGDYTGGPRIVTAETKAEMRKMLEEIRSGQYAKGWIEENATGRKWFDSQRRQERSQRIEKVGAELRALMPFLHPVTITDEETVGAGAPPNG